MSNQLSKRQKKIQERREKTDWNNFLMEVWSRLPLTMHKNNWNVSRYPSSMRTQNLMNNKEFQKVRDEMEQYWQEYTWSFKDNFASLFQKSPLSATIQQWTTTESDYADEIINSSLCYLSYAVVDNCDNIMWSLQIVDNCSDIHFSSRVSKNSQNIYWSRVIESSSSIFYSQKIINSNNIWFSSSLVWCQDCILCKDLENKSYCIKNKQYTREEFLAKKKELLKNKDKFHDFLMKVWDVENTNSENVTWKFLTNCENIENWYFLQRVKNGKNLVSISGWNMNKMYDCIWCGSHADDFYAMQWSWSNGSHNYCSCLIENSHEIYYSYYLENCSFCLWCIWLKNKSYCILNKQYTKEDRYDEVDKIFSQMEKDWQLWEFFSWTMNPFYFNDTAAYLINPSFTKEEVTAKWYLRRDEPIKVDIPSDATVVKSTDLDQYESFDTEWNRTINADILKVVIQDEQENYYRIVPMEYKFLVKHWLPLPRKHWLERMKDNFKIG